MSRDEACRHTSPVVINAVEGGGWWAHCLRCGLLGPVSADSVEALDSIQRSEHRTIARGAGEARYAYGASYGADRNPAHLEELGES